MFRITCHSTFLPGESHADLSNSHHRIRAPEKSKLALEQLLQAFGFIPNLGVSISNSPKLVTARQVQQVILPEAIENVPGFRVETVYHPAQQVGGDFFQVIPAGSGGMLVVIGDVAAASYSHRPLTTDSKESAVFMVTSIGICAFGTDSLNGVKCSEEAIS